jgi:hypothetical protein
MREWICGRCYTRTKAEAARACPSCGAEDVVPADSPRGKGMPKPKPSALKQAVMGALMAVILVFVFWTIFSSDDEPKKTARGAAVVSKEEDGFRQLERRQQLAETLEKYWREQGVEVEVDVEAVDPQTLVVRASDCSQKIVNAMAAAPLLRGLPDIGVTTLACEYREGRRFHADLTRFAPDAGQR